MKASLCSADAFSQGKKSRHDEQVYRNKQDGQNESEIKPRMGSVAEAEACQEEQDNQWAAAEPEDVVQRTPEPEGTEQRQGKRRQENQQTAEAYETECSGCGMHCRLSRREIRKTMQILNGTADLHGILCQK